MLWNFPLIWGATQIFPHYSLFFPFLRYPKFYSCLKYLWRLILLNVGNEAAQKSKKVLTNKGNFPFHFLFDKCLLQLLCVSDFLPTVWDDSPSWKQHFLLAHASSVTCVTPGVAYAIIPTQKGTNPVPAVLTALEQRLRAVSWNYRAAEPEEERGRTLKPWLYTSE